ncbi:MAG: chromate transporter, partial [Streptosporangiaceae bacterium]
ATPSWKRAADARRVRWIGYLLAGAAAAATIGPWLVLVLLGCGLTELAIYRQQAGGARAVALLPLLAGRAIRSAGPVRALGAAAGGGVLLPVAWTALKVGALSFGGGFVIIPLMQADAVGHHWMTSGQFLNGVALGQITPGPVVQTVATVGYAAAGIGGGLLAALVAFSPSFVFVRSRPCPASRSLAPRSCWSSPSPRSWSCAPRTCAASGRPAGSSRSRRTCSPGRWS